MIWYDDSNQLNDMIWWQESVKWYDMMTGISEMRWHDDRNQWNEMTWWQESVKWDDVMTGISEMRWHDDRNQWNEMMAEIRMCGISGLQRPIDSCAPYSKS